MTRICRIFDVSITNKTKIMSKLRLFATIDLSYNGGVNKGVWEVVYPVADKNGKFKVPQRAKEHSFYSVIKSSVDPIFKSGKCVIFQPYTAGWNDCIKKSNASDFYFAESVNGKRIISVATETLIEEIKELL